MKELIRELLDKEIDIILRSMATPDHYIIELQYTPFSSNKEMKFVHGWVKGFDNIESKVNDLLKELNEDR